MIIFTTIFYHYKLLNFNITIKIPKKKKNITLVLGVVYKFLIKQRNRLRLIQLITIVIKRLII